MSTTAYAGIAATCFLGICVCIGIFLHHALVPSGRHNRSSNDIFDWNTGHAELRQAIAWWDAAKTLLPFAHQDPAEHPDFGDDDEEFDDDDDDEDYGYDDDDNDDQPTELLMNVPSQVEIWAGFAPWEALINSGELAETPWIPVHLRRVAA